MESSLASYKFEGQLCVSVFSGYVQQRQIEITIKSIMNSFHGDLDGVSLSCFGPTSSFIRYQKKKKY